MKNHLLLNHLDSALLHLYVDYVAIIYYKI